MIVGKVEIKKHHHAGLGTHAGERDQSYPDGNAEIVAEQVEHPKRANQRQGHREHDDGCPNKRARVEINNQHDNQQRNGNDNHQALLSAQHVFVLAAPENVISARQLDRLIGDGLVDGPLGHLHVRADVDAFHIHINPGIGHGAFAFDPHRRPDDIDFCQLTEGDLGAGWRGNDDFT